MSRKQDQLKIRVGRRNTRRNRRRDLGFSGTALWPIPLFLLLCLVVDLLWRPPAWLALVYLVASASTFAVYAADKASATRGGRRTPERVLHAMAVAGGWPGALLAQRFLRHKSAKAAFRRVFWVTVLVNLAGFVVLSSPAVGDAFQRASAPDALQTRSR